MNIGWVGQILTGIRKTDPNIHSDTEKGTLSMQKMHFKTFDIGAYPIHTLLRLENGETWGSTIGSNNTAQCVSQSWDWTSLICVIHPTFFFFTPIVCFLQLAATTKEYTIETMWFLYFHPCGTSCGSFYFMFHWNWLLLLSTGNERRALTLTEGS